MLIDRGVNMGKRKPELGYAPDWLDRRSRRHAEQCQRYGNECRRCREVRVGRERLLHQGSRQKRGLRRLFPFDTDTPSALCQAALGSFGLRHRHTTHFFCHNGFGGRSSESTPEQNETLTDLLTIFFEHLCFLRVGGVDIEGTTLCNLYRKHTTFPLRLCAFSGGMHGERKKWGLS